MDQATMMGTPLFKYIMAANCGSSAAIINTKPNLNSSRLLSFKHRKRGGRLQWKMNTVQTINSLLLPYPSGMMELVSLSTCFLGQGNGKQLTR
jgi:hypothetical protein